MDTGQEIDRARTNSREEIAEKTPKNVDNEKNFLTKVDGTFEWKLTLCHVPASLPFTEVGKYFRPIILKKLEKGAQYGGRQVMEVSFRTQSDIEHAVDLYQHKYLMGHGVTLALPDEAEKEMADTKAGWKSLPFYLVGDILKLVAPFRTGKPSKRHGLANSYAANFLPVCQMWQEFIGEAEELFVNTIYCDFADMPSSPPKYPQNVSKLVSLSQTFIGLRGVFQASSGLSDLVLYNCQDLKHIHVYFPHRYLSRFVKTIACIDSFIEFSFAYGGRDEEWMVYIYVPYLKSDFTSIGLPDESDLRGKYVHGARQLVTAIDHLDLWWPYPIEQTEWLSQALQKIPPKIRKKIASFLAGFMDVDFDSYIVYSGVQGCRLAVTPTQIKFGSFVLDKRDSLVVGLYIDSLGLKNVAPPPYPWLSCFIKHINGHGYVIDAQKRKALKDETRLRARKALRLDREPLRSDGELVLR